MIGAAFRGVAMVTVVAGATAGARAATPAAHAQSEVQAAMNISAAAWSSGDLDRFMTCYENSSETTYVSGTRLVKGYDAIRAMYAERFGGGSKDAMGQLSLEILDFRLVGPGFAYVIGRFHLHRDAAHGGDATGSTTLLFKHMSSGWQIVADHS